MDDVLEMRDTFYMRKALDIAIKSIGKTSPNPMVGCVIVKNGKIIAEGYHKKAGKAHAEIEAINNSLVSLEGATLYVTLEPCYHSGKTPPCVDRILKEKISRVVIALKDPNPLVAGKSIRKLKKNGVEVRVGVFKQEALKLNEVFVTNMQKKRPYVVAKWAMTLDGCIADKSGKSKWITSKEARNRARQIRSYYDAVCVGVNTIINDDPELNGIAKKIKKVIVDPSLRTPADAIVFKRFSEVYIVCDKKFIDNRKYPDGVILVPVNRKNGKFSIEDMLDKLYAYGVMSLFVEGGSYTLGSFFDACLVDKVFVFTAPKIFGNSQACRPISGSKYPDFGSMLELNDYRHRLVGAEYMSEGYPVYRNRYKYKK